MYTMWEFLACQGEDAVLVLQHCNFYSGSSLAETWIEGGSEIGHKNS